MKARKKERTKDIGKRDFAALLRKNNACRDGLQFCKGRSFVGAWSLFDRPDWMIWLAGRMGVPLGVMRAVVNLTRPESSPVNVDNVFASTTRRIWMSVHDCSEESAKLIRRALPAGEVLRWYDRRGR